MKLAMLATLVLGLVMTSTAFADTQKAPTPPTAPAASEKETVTPKPITYGDSTMNGDTAVISDITALQNLDMQIEKLKTQADTEKTKKDFETLKRVNGWGEDVQFDPQTQTWFRLKTPAPEKTLVPAKTPAPVK